MFCYNCGSGLKEGSKFCHICGARLDSISKSTPPTPAVRPKCDEQLCPACNRIFSKYSHICPHCGHRKTSTSAPEQREIEREKKWPCDNCGFSNNANAKECANCGTSKPTTLRKSYDYNDFSYSGFSKVWFWIQLISNAFAGLLWFVVGIMLLGLEGSLPGSAFGVGFVCILLSVMFGILMSKKNKASAGILIGINILSQILMLSFMSTLYETLGAYSNVSNDFSMFIGAIANTTITLVLVLKDWKNLR